MRTRREGEGEVRAEHCCAFSTTKEEHVRGRHGGERGVRLRARLGASWESKAAPAELEASIYRMAVLVCSCWTCAAPAKTRWLQHIA